jgi:hypothetical protein
MEADIMARPARFRSSILLILCAGIFGCSDTAPKKPVTVPAVLLNKSQQQLTMENGLLLLGHTPFSGRLFTLFPGTIDTAELAGYFNGKEQGEWKKYYRSKKIKERRFFEQGQKTGEYMAWWENGNQQLQYFFVAGEYEGTCKEWSETGLLNKIMNYKKGHEDGQQQWWYDNGKIKANYIISAGRRYGLLGTKNCINVSDSIFNN